MASGSSTVPSHHANKTRSLFKNPFLSASPPTLFELASSPFPLTFSTPDPILLGHRHAKEVNVITPTWRAKSEAVELQEEVNSKGKGTSNLLLRGTWLGHASCFLEFPIAGENVRILFDPIFSTRAGPTSYTGPSRISSAPSTVDDLPGLDVVCISHNHYDHLDTPTILALLSRFPQAKYFVPLGLRTFLLGSGIPEEIISELDWWESIDLSSLELGFKEGVGKLRLTCVPAQHNSGRNPTDLATSLWCGWVVEGLTTENDTSSLRRGSIYFAGDTGYRRYSNSKEVCPAFKEIGEKLGPFDLAFIPIWRGGTLGFFSWLGFRLSHESLFSAFHCSPTDAVAIHQDVQSRNSIGIHFGTFIGHRSESLEAVIELMETCQREGISGLEVEGEGETMELVVEEGGKKKWKGRMGVIDQGETIAIVI